MSAIHALPVQSLYPVAQAQAAKRVHFGATTSADTVHLAYWKQSVQYVDEAKLSPAFRENTLKGLEQMWKGLPADLQKALKQHHYQVLLAPTPSSGLRKVMENDAAVDQMAAHLEQQKAQALNGKSLFESELQTLCEQVKTEPEIASELNRALEKLKRDKGDPGQVLFLEALLKGDVNSLPEKVRKREMIKLVLGTASLAMNSAFYPSGSGVVVIPEKADENIFDIFSILSGPPFWNKLQKTAEVMERVQRHETVHFIDDKLGISQTGKSFSLHPAFREAVLTDQARAKATGRWPSSRARIEQGPMKGALLSHYFPEAFEKAQKGFAEAFAECGSALLGGGALEPAYVKRLYPRAMAWVEKNALQPYGLEPQPKTFRDKILDAVHSFMDSVRSFFRKLFGWLRKSPPETPQPA